MPRGGGGGVPRSAKEANNPILLKVQSLQLSFRPAGVSLGGGGGGPRPPLAPPCVRPCTSRSRTFQPPFKPGGGGSCPPFHRLWHRCNKHAPHLSGGLSVVTAVSAGFRTTISL